MAPYRRCQPTVEWASRGAVLAVHIVARGKTNGAEVDVRFYPHFKLRDDRVVYIYDYAHRAEALAAVGLGEWAMSQETVRLAREVLDALGTHDAARLIELSDPEVEWRSFFALSERGVYCGYDGTREYMSDLRDAFEVVFAEVDDALGIADIAICVGRIRYKGKGSGIEGASPAGWMLKFREGKLLRFSAFRDPAQALEAVSLKE